MMKVECGKCNGHGYIKAFNHIAAGVCFRCEGRGYHLRKRAPRKSFKYSFSAVLIETQETIGPIFWIKAYNDKDAMKKITKTLNGKMYDVNTISLIKA